MKIAKIQLAHCYNCPFNKDKICGRAGREIVYPNQWECHNMNFPTWCPLEDEEYV